jgi:Response regulator containing CheY-like receiver, AAA-type ATPase, and DNA-binding domains
MKVLVIDDNELMQQVLSHFLAMMGHESTPALSLKSALQLSSQQSFDSYLIDMYLPDAEGPEVLEALRKLPGNSNPLAIAISGDTFIPQSVLKRAGFLSYLTKPIQFSEFQAHMNRISQLLATPKNDS